MGRFGHAIEKALPLAPFFGGGERKFRRLADAVAAGARQVHDAEFNAGSAPIDHKDPAPFVAGERGEVRRPTGDRGRLAPSRGVDVGTDPGGHPEQNIVPIQGPGRAEGPGGGRGETAFEFGLAGFPFDALQPLHQMRQLEQGGVEIFSRNLPPGAVGPAHGHGTQGRHQHVDPAAEIIRRGAEGFKGLDHRRILRLQPAVPRRGQDRPAGIANEGQTLRKKPAGKIKKSVRRQVDLASVGRLARFQGPGGENQPVVSNFLGKNPAPTQGLPEDDSKLVAARLSGRRGDPDIKMIGPAVQPGTPKGPHRGNGRRLPQGLGPASGHPPKKPGHPLGRGVVSPPKNRIRGQVFDELRDGGPGGFQGFSPGSFQRPNVDLLRPAAGPGPGPKEIVKNLDPSRSQFQGTVVEEVHHGTDPRTPLDKPPVLKFRVAQSPEHPARSVKGIVQQGVSASFVVLRRVGGVETFGAPAVVGEVPFVGLLAKPLALTKEQGRAPPRRRQGARETRPLRHPIHRHGFLSRSPRPAPATEGEQTGVAPTGQGQDRAGAPQPFQGQPVDRPGPEDALRGRDLARGGNRFRKREGQAARFVRRDRKSPIVKRPAFPPTVFGLDAALQGFGREGPLNQRFEGVGEHRFFNRGDAPFTGAVEIPHLPLRRERGNPERQGGGVRIRVHENDFQTHRIPFHPRAVISHRESVEPEQAAGAGAVNLVGLPRGANTDQRGGRVLGGQGLVGQGLHQLGGRAGPPTEEERGEFQVGGQFLPGLVRGIEGPQPFGVDFRFLKGSPDGGPHGKGQRAAPRHGEAHDRVLAGESHGRDPRPVPVKEGALKIQPLAFAKGHVEKAVVPTIGLPADVDFALVSLRGKRLKGPGPVLCKRQRRVRGLAKEKGQSFPKIFLPGPLPKAREVRGRQGRKNDGFLGTRQGLGIPSNGKNRRVAAGTFAVQEQPFPRPPHPAKGEAWGAGQADKTEITPPFPRPDVHPPRGGGVKTPAAGVKALEGFPKLIGQIVPGLVDVQGQRVEHPVQKFPPALLVGSKVVDRGGRRRRGGGAEGLERIAKDALQPRRLLPGQAGGMGQKVLRAGRPGPAAGLDLGVFLEETTDPFQSDGLDVFFHPRAVNRWIAEGALQPQEPPHRRPKIRSGVGPDFRQIGPRRPIPRDAHFEMNGFEFPAALRTEVNPGFDALGNKGGFAHRHLARRGQGLADPSQKGGHRLPGHLKGRRPGGGKIVDQEDSQFRGATPAVPIAGDEIRPAGLRVAVDRNFRRPGGRFDRRPKEVPIQTVFFEIVQGPPRRFRSPAADAQGQGRRHGPNRVEAVPAARHGGPDVRGPKQSGGESGGQGPPTAESHHRSREAPGFSPKGEGGGTHRHHRGQEAGKSDQGGPEGPGRQ